MWKPGRSQLRIEDDALLRGAGAFTGDRDKPDALHMVVVRSPTAAGRLLGIDVEAARDMPGVVGILTAAEQGADGLGRIRPRLRHPGPGGREMLEPEVLPLATDLLQYVGHPVAVVLAESRAQAGDAAEAVLVDFEDRDSVTDPLAAMAEGAPRVWPDMPDNLCFRVEKGDAAAVEAALDSAAQVTRARLRINRVTAAALEPREALAEYTGEGRYRLDVGTQTPHRVASDLAAVLGVDPADIRIVSQDTGGSFGMKNAAYVEYALALWAARRTGRPVAWRASRSESFLSDAHARDQWAEAAIALDDQGRITALKVHVTAGLGACLGPATTHPPVANLAGLAGVYTTPAIHVIADGVFTNCQQVAPYRGAGRPEATYIVERMIDLAAREAGLDRVELRRRNLIPPAALPHQTPLGWIYDSGDFAGVMDKALEAADWAGFPERRQATEAKGLLRGIGIANPIEIAGGPVKKPHPEFAAVSIRPQGNGRITLGSCSSGQGHATVFRQIACDRLGLDPASVEFVAGDTGRVEKGIGTFGSRTLAAAGTALWDAMNAAIEAARPVAAAMLDTEPDTLDFAEGAYAAPGGGRVTFLEAVARGQQPVETDAYTSAELATFPNGCHVCEVEVDPETGTTRIVRYTVVDDVGTVINPLLLKGQIAGGVAQGAGQALMENIAYDPDTGQLLSASFMDYALPRFGDLPPIDVLSHPVPTEANPLGVKGAGEAGVVGAIPACINAVCDALSSRGISHLDMPATPGRVWSALREAAR